jgi:hypothetical protein
VDERDGQAEREHVDVHHDLDDHVDQHVNLDEHLDFDQHLDFDEYPAGLVTRVGNKRLVQYCGIGKALPQVFDLFWIEPELIQRRQADANARWDRIRCSTQPVAREFQRDFIHEKLNG